MKKIYLYSIIFFIILITIFFYIKNNNQEKNSRLNNFKKIHQNDFSGDLIDGDLYLKATDNRNDIIKFNKSIFVNINEINFEEINTKIIDNEEILLDENLPVIKINFKFLNQFYNSFSYGKKSDLKKALLIIPGSGSNQSSKIYLNDKENYHHGLKSEFEKYFDIYVFIKPNEDFLSVHNGSNKINYDYIYNWHLNNGGSYSFSYILQSIALTDYLKKNYEDVVVAGLSQGGEAAFINSLYTEPKYSIISSGVSSSILDLEVASRDQIVIPNKFIYNQKFLQSNFSDLKTLFLFSWGENEHSIEYRSEAKSKKTCNFYKDIVNLKCFYGDKHEFPIEFITSIIEKN